MHDVIRHLLLDVFNQDFSKIRDAGEFHRVFFAKKLALSDLKKISAAVRGSQISLDGEAIPAAIMIPGRSPGLSPFAVVAQLHGNEPAGNAGIALAMALSQMGQLTRDVIGVIGNPLAAGQYFEAWSAHPNARQETRDAYRCGLDEQGNLLPDMNRIPVDFMERDPAIPNIKRAQELYLLGQHISGVADIHSARGHMVCITDYKYEKHLKHCPIRDVLTGLADAISAHASAAVTVRTLKTTLATLPNIESQTGIEAGSHEEESAPFVAASFTLSLLHTLGLTKMPPFYDKEDGVFNRYAVRPRITYADLIIEGKLQADDLVYMAKELPPLTSPPPAGGINKNSPPASGGTTGGNIVEYQYEEMEAVKKGQVVAVAKPSGALFRAPYDFSGIFWSKSGALYDKDPSVGPWPVKADKLASTKFCFPCDVSRWEINS